jgi:hypothetical protein
MVRCASRTGWDVEYHDAAVGMHYRVHINTKAKPRKQLLCDVVGIRKRARPYDCSWRSIGYTQDKLATASLAMATQYAHNFWVSY